MTFPALNVCAFLHPPLPGMGNSLTHTSCCQPDDLIVKVTPDNTVINHHSSQCLVHDDDSNKIIDPPPNIRNFIPRKSICYGDNNKENVYVHNNIKTNDVKESVNKILPFRSFQNEMSSGLETLESYIEEVGKEQQDSNNKSVENRKSLERTNILRKLVAKAPNSNKKCFKSKIYFSPKQEESSEVAKIETACIPCQSIPSLSLPLCLDDLVDDCLRVCLTIAGSASLPLDCSLRLVCRRWSQLQLTMSDRRIHRDMLASLIPIGKKYMSMDKIFQLLNSKFLQQRIKSISLSGILDESHLTLLSTSKLIDAICFFTKLTSLSLAELRFVNDKHIALIVLQCPRLTHLDLSYCSDVSDEGCRMLSNHCKALTSLDVSGCDSVTAQGLQYLSSSFPTTLACLKLCNNQCVKASDLLQLQLPELLELSLRGVTLNQFIHLHSTFPKLQHLDIGLWRDSTDEAFKNSILKMSTLLSLNLDGCSSLSMENLFTIQQQCPRLFHLNIGNCHRILLSEEESKSLSIKMETKIPILLNITELDAYQCRCINDSTLARLLKIFPNVQTLNVSGTKLSDAVLPQFRQLGYLKELSIAECPDTSDVGIVALVGEQWNELISLSFGHNGRMAFIPFTNNILKALSTSARNLRCLEITGSQCTDEGVKALAPGCPFLSSLSLARSDITDIGLSFLLTHLKLKSLCIRGCRLITKNAVMTARQQIKSINY